MMKSFSRVSNTMILIISCFTSNQCLTGIYLSDHVFGTEETVMDQLLLLGLLSQNSSSGSNSSPIAGNSETNDETEIPETEPGPTPRVVAPTFNHSPSVFSSPVSISLNSETDDSEIYYTLDGEEPQLGASNTTLFQEPLPISSIAGLTIRAKAIKENYDESEETTGLYSLRTLRTGQVNSFQPNDDGSLQPGGEFNYTGPTQHPVYTNDFTTTDNYTGLVWKTCREGRSGADCSDGSNPTYTWDNAVSVCNALNNQNAGNGYAGRTDWRLPEFRELESLYRYNIGGNPAITTTAFPNNNQGVASPNFWSNTTSNAWPLNGEVGAIDLQFRGGLSALNMNTQPSLSYLVRCVSGNPQTMATPNFVDNGDGTILDNTSGMIWTKCGHTQTLPNCNGTGALNWQSALNYCNQLSNDNFAGRNWRLPTIRELVTILNPQRTSNPRTYTNLFPNTMQMYWSSTTRADTTSQAWVVNFNEYRIRSIQKNIVDAVVYARCVAVD